MSVRSNSPGVRTPFRIAALYALIGVLWILFSDRLLFALFTDPDILTSLQTVKGWFYVLLTAVLLYLLIAGMSSRLKSTYTELAAEKDYNNTLIRRLPLGLALCSMDGQLVDANPAYAAIIGRTVEETMTLSYWDITPRNYAEQEQAQLDSLKATGRYGPYEKEYIHKDGHLVPVRLTGLIVRRDNEDFIWSTVEDITEQQKASKALQQSEEKFMKAFHATPDAIIISRENDGMLVDINEVFIQQSEYTRDEALGRTILELNLWADPLDRERYVAVLKEQEKVREMEARFRTKSGRFIDCLVSGEFFPLDNEFYLLTIVRDITERKAAEAELEKYHLHLEEIVKERTSDLLHTQEALQYLLEDVNEAKKELETKLAEIERMNRIFVDRELRMVELKEKIMELERKLKGAGRSA